MKLKIVREGKPVHTQQHASDASGLSLHLEGVRVCVAWHGVGSKCTDIVKYIIHFQHTAWHRVLLVLVVYK